MSLPLFPTGPLQVPPLGLPLRWYQKEAVDSIYQWFDRETGNPLIVLPTGAGKSLVIAGFIHSVLAQWPSERIVILTHVKELIAQNHAQMLRCWPGAPAGIYSAGLRRREADAPILFAGIQSVFRKAREIGWVDLILVDEAHLIPKDGFGMYRQLLGDLTSMNSKLKVIGLTATPFRTGEGSLEKGEDRLFHGIAYSADLPRLIKEGWLSPVVSKSTHAPINTVGVHTQGGEFVAKELEQAAMAGNLVADAVSEIVARGKDRKSWLLFCCGVDHANAVADELARHKIPCAGVYGDTPAAERDEIVAAFKAGELRAIVNVNVLTTGFDAPQVDLIALLRPTKSPGLFVQMVGRGLRRADGKTDCLVLDFGENVRRHGPIDCVEVREPGKRTGEAADEVRAKLCPTCESLVATAARQCPDCGYEWPAPEPTHHAKPDEDVELVRGTHPNGGIERWNVQVAIYRRHQKKDKPDTLCAEYRCGFHQSAREWICFDHPVSSFPRRKAEMWWQQHGGQLPAPESVDIALCRIEGKELDEPESITVDVRGEFPELKGVRMKPREPGEQEFAEPVEQHPSADDIPF